MSAIFSRVRLLAAQVLVLRVIDELLQRSCVIAAVVCKPRGNGVSILEGRNEILRSKVDGIDSKLRGHLVHHPFKNERCLRTTGAAIRLDWRGVGVDTIDILFDGWNIVWARKHQPMKDRRY